MPTKTLADQVVTIPGLIPSSYLPLSAVREIVRQAYMESHEDEAYTGGRSWSEVSNDYEASDVLKELAKTASIKERSDGA